MNTEVHVRLQIVIRWKKEKKASTKLLPESLQKSQITSTLRKLWFMTTSDDRLS